MDGATILVVDDEPGVVRLCQRLLERRGFQVTAVSSSNQALAALDQERVQLMLADIRMPGASGFHLMEAARRRQPDISVVLMTGFGTVDVAIEALQRGADGLILKPFSGAELVQGVDMALQENQRKRDSLRLQVLRPLFDITKVFFSETDPSRLEELVIDSVHSHLECSFVGEYLRDESQGRIVLLRQTGAGMEAEWGRGLAEVVEYTTFQNAAVWINREGEEKTPADLRGIFDQFGLQSILCVPLQHKGRQIMLLAARGVGEPAFIESDLEMLVILSRQAAVAFENAALYDALRESMLQVERSQTALIRAEKMATAGRLTASIAHEINNPLQSLSNFLYLAAREDLSGSNQKRYLKNAQKELERLMGTVQHLLDLYRPGARDRQWVRLQDLIRNVLSLTMAQLESKAIQTHVKESSSLPPVLVVESQLQQVLLSLVLDAAETMPAGGKLGIHAAKASDHVDITITCSSVEDANQSRLFPPGLDVFGEDDFRGLSLTVCSGILEAHGGSLEIAADQSKGFCFKIALPVGEKK
ncbi:MAG: response regulator [Chloroflexi bacterium]|nr:response regulator [Chloroflexota bacterium]